MKHRRPLTMLLIMAAIAGTAAAALHLSFGGGEPYPDLTTRPLLPESALAQVAAYPEPVGGVAATGDGRLFFTVHPAASTPGPRLLEWVDGAAVPWPDAGSQALFDTVLALALDAQGRLWTLDHGRHGSGTPRLLAFDLATGAIAHDYRFGSESAPLGSLLTALQVSADGHRVYVADASLWRRRPALVVYDVEEHMASRVLEGHPALVAQDWQIKASSRAPSFLGGWLTLRPGLAGLALDAAGEWLYLAATAHDGLYRIRTADLQDPELAPAALARRVERVGDKPLSAGLAIDAEGRVYVADVEHGAVHRLDPDGALATVVRSGEIRWPDALCFGPDRMLYVGDSALGDIVGEARDRLAAGAPYGIFGLSLGASQDPER